MLVVKPIVAKEYKSHSVEAEKSVFAPKTIYLVPSTEKISLTIAKNKSLTLPKYKKVEECYPFYSSLDNVEAQFEESRNKTLAQQKEIQELADKLHMTNLDRNYIAFYKEVASWLGTHYQLGSMNQKAVDCSGFTKIIYNTVFNKDIPRTSRDMSNSLTESISSIKELHPGDLVFFSTFGRKYINHVGMYLGEGNFIHASIKGVKVSSLTDGYYNKAWRKGGRID